MERCSSLACIRRNIYEILLRNLTNLHETEIWKRKATCRDYYVPQTKESISVALISAFKKYALRYYQLKFGYNADETFLIRIKVIKTPEY